MITTILASAIAVGNYVPSEPSYVGNAYSRGNGEVCFDLPEGLIDWFAVALDSLGPETVRNPSVEILRRNYFEPGGVSIQHFEAPAPPQVSDSPWLILHETGLVVVNHATLRGELMYEVDQAFMVLGEPRAFGEACGHVDDPSLRAAFVVNGIPVAEWSMQTPSPATEGPGRFSINSGGQRYAFERPRFAVPRIKKVLVLRKTGETTLTLAVFEEDSDCEVLCCEHAYSLYELHDGGVIRLIGENGYGCDV